MLSSLQECRVDIRRWMSKNFLQVNLTKTEILLIGSSNRNIHILPSTGQLSEYIKPVARNLGVLFDCNLNFEQQIMKLVQTCFYQLKNIARMFLSSFRMFLSNPILTFKDTETILPKQKNC